MEPRSCFTTFLSGKRSFTSLAADGCYNVSLSGQRPEDRRETQFKVFPKKARLDALDGWRAFAVLLVILNHLILFSALRSRISESLLIPGEFGHLGVNIFFTISGYVISLALLKEYEDFGRISLPAFYIRRCFRILPPLWCYLAVIVMLSHAGIIDTTATQERNAAMFVCNLPIADCDNWPVGHTWSLAYEEQFYILFPITILLVSPRRRNIFLGFFLILPLSAIVFFFRNWHNTVLYLTRFEFLLTGVVMALFSDEISPYIRKLRPAVIYLFLAAFFAIDYFSHGEPPPVMILKILVQGPLIGVILFYTSHFPCAARTLFLNPGVRFMGRISYGIYLWQQLATRNYQGAGILFYTCSLGLTALVCVASFYWIEQPLIRLGAKLSRAQIGRDAAAPLVASREYS